MTSVVDPIRFFREKSLLVVGLFCSFLFSACTSDPQENERTEKRSTQEFEYTTLQGETQGTTYTITFLDTVDRDLHAEIDDLLIAFDNSLSTWNPGSIITSLNAYGNEEIDSFFVQVMEVSRLVYHETGGAFNPAIFPLIERWGFGTEEIDELPTDAEIDSLLRFTDFDRVTIDWQVNSNDSVPTIQLPQGYRIEFNAVAQGLSVDFVAAYLESKGISNYKVNIGGELRCAGLSPKQRVWRIGVEKPEMDAYHEPFSALEIENQGMATSGNYRKFKEVDGMKFSHTIDPVTGRPVHSRLLSATIIAPTAAEADAYATAMMVMGFDKAQEFITTHGDRLHIQAYFIYSDENASYLDWHSFENDNKKITL